MTGKTFLRPECSEGPAENGFPVFSLLFPIIFFICSQLLDFFIH